MEAGENELLGGIRCRSCILFFDNVLVWIPGKKKACILPAGVLLQPGHNLVDFYQTSTISEEPQEQWGTAVPQLFVGSLHITWNDNPKEIKYK